MPCSALKLHSTAAPKAGSRTEAGSDSDSSEGSAGEGSAGGRRGGHARHGASRRAHSRVRRVPDRVDPHDIEEAEDQLETYYVKVDAALRRLLMMSEAIDANEDMVDIQVRRCVADMCTACSV